MAPRRFTLRTLPAGDARAKILPEAIDAPLDASIEHDGQRIDCRAGEPLALSLLAAGHTTLTRSPKYHRPRGAMCLRGACEGCLVRVDGVPDVMACRVRVRDGMRVESQNAFPSASIDVFRVTDWFFPKHMDHHHLMVAMGRTLNDTMQVIARRMAGLGTLPDDVGPAYAPSERACDVLVVGAGSAGISAANALSRRGLNVLCVDSEPAPGGWARDVSDGTPLEALDTSVTFLAEHTAVASFVNGTLVAGDDGLTQVRARARLFANGCHETVGTFAQNDLPGLYTARAAMRALRAGVSLGRTVVMVGALAGMSSLADALRAVGARVTHLPEAEVLEAHGARHVTGVTVTGHKKLACDALVVGVAPQSSYELAGQCGAELEWQPARGCFAPVADASGRTRTAGVYVAGSLRNAGRSRVEDAVRASREDGARVAGSIAMDLAGRDWEQAQR